MRFASLVNPTIRFMSSSSSRSRTDSELIAGLTMSVSRRPTFHPLPLGIQHPTPIAARELVNWSSAMPTTAGRAMLLPPCASIAPVVGALIGPAILDMSVGHLTTPRWLAAHSPQTTRVVVAHH